MASGKLRRGSSEHAPGTLAFVARDVSPLEPEYFVEKGTIALVLGRACEPPEPMVSSTIYAVLLSQGGRFRLYELPHCDLLV
jgi:hypothetical protein